MSTFRICFKIVFAAAALSAVAATPLRAQQVISEPGYCAFFYPNANCQNKGPGNPYTDPNYRGYAGQSMADQTIVPTQKRPRTRRSDSYGARMQY
jgi:hypothetical protein